VSNVGRYRVIRRLGSGGMAEVLEAEALGDAGFVRRVAIKRMLGTANEDPSFARMFVDEARIASRLHHANIVSVLDYGIVDGTPFQVLELVDGVDARTLIRRGEGGKVPVDIALYLVAQIGHALAAAHEATDVAGEPLGIVHRDVSPGNVLVSWDGDVKLADFGIAFAKDKSEKTEAGTTKGTLVYMSPEQAITGRVDRRADVFSLGCVLHALLTGASPLAGDHFTQFLSEQKLPIADGLPEDVHSIIEIATQYDREQRFQSAIALTEAVGRALASRVEREPRRRLVEYLAPLRRKAPEVRGRLDALLRVDIVVTAADPTLREFHTAALDATETALSTRVEPTSDPSPTPAPPSRRRRGWIAGGAALVMGAGVLGGAWMFQARVTPTGTGLTPVAATVQVSPAEAASPAASHGGLLPSEAAQPEPATEPVTSAKPTSSAATPRKAPSSARSASSPAVSVASASPATTKCAGTIYLSCPLAPRASIAIDGVVTGYHHGDFAELSCSAHAITFEPGDGRHANRGASPTSANTRTSPLEIRCGL
jgi:serine/threonine protein kinase